MRAGDEKRGRTGGKGGGRRGERAYSFVACLSRSTVGHASF